ncbi:alpha-lactalbumin [Mustela lutreola]|uniref:Lactose synthase B protein n=1 Tax=Mustela putorius furo TaxID=9669 RepID=M3YU15_MUSPF|nr:alpha-lactalbumin [Mustela putorius furo]XP_059039575.1 alpha-lactalbumin [Mustela lutreola]
MMSFISLLLVGIMFPAIQAKQFTKCELSQVLKDMDGFGGIALPEWICTIFHTSGYDTQTIVNNNGSTEYGLFQINNKVWCKDNKILQSRNICNISCDKFLDDDLTDDMTCAKKILNKEGIDYWLAHKPLCSEKLEQWHCEKL